MLVLMDLDNTLADRHAAFLVWARAKVRDWGLHEDALALLVEADQDGFRPRIEFLQALRDSLGLRDPVDELLLEYRAKTLAAFPPLDQRVARLLRELRVRGGRTAIVTNGDAGVQEATAQAVGVTELVDAVVVSGTVGVRKPERRIFELAARAAGASLESGWMIGDGEVDIIGAANAGLRSVWLARGRAWQRADVRPDHVVADAEAALQLVLG